ncbi:MAG TPA: hypothetical protein VHZ24_20275 [Pirellulales bacterium]|jgi:hypothetical protein|nr:hypothetical protein [Pirellulales bacterium]
MDILRHWLLFVAFVLIGALAGEWLSEAGELPIGATGALLGAGVGIVSFVVIVSVLHREKV